jgi:hypothetical protein
MLEEHPKIMVSAGDNAKKYIVAGVSEHVLVLWKDLSPSNTTWGFLEGFSLGLIFEGLH